MSLLKNGLAKMSFILVDGGLATLLETKYNQDLNSDPLWSGKLLITNPNIITQAHLDYLLSGANIIITSSYQAHVNGLMKSKYNLSKFESMCKIYESSLLAKNAIEKYEKQQISHVQETKKLQFIAGSIGCFGASLHDGSEYTGNYGKYMNYSVLYHYHKEKMFALLAKFDKSGELMDYNATGLLPQLIDLFACETIPNMVEIEVLCDLIFKTTLFPSWITMACKNDTQLNSGESVSNAIDLICKYCIEFKKTYGKNNMHMPIVGIGFNCTHPKYISNLIEIAKKCLKKFELWQEIAIVVYPNTGEQWDGTKHEWIQGTKMTDKQFAKFSVQWYELGAKVIGGCCRTTPDTIAHMYKSLNYCTRASKL